MPGATEQVRGGVRSFGGELESLRQIEAYSQRYFGESRKYRRPIATNFFSNQGDYHTYYKGGTVMMSLRKLLGDAAFFRGLNRYLTRHYLGNVETNDLVEDMTASGAASPRSRSTAASSIVSAMVEVPCALM